MAFPCLQADTFPMYRATALLFILTCLVALGVASGCSSYPPGYGDESALPDCEETNGYPPCVYDGDAPNDGTYQGGDYYPDYGGSYYPGTGVVIVPEPVPVPAPVPTPRPRRPPPPKHHAPPPRDCHSTPKHRCP
jgi:hypothetical protein